MTINNLVKVTVVVACVAVATVAVFSLYDQVMGAPKSWKDSPGRETPRERRERVIKSGAIPSKIEFADETPDKKEEEKKDKEDDIEERVDKAVAAAIAKLPQDKKGKGFDITDSLSMTTDRHGKMLNNLAQQLNSLSTAVDKLQQSKDIGDGKISLEPIRKALDNLFTNVAELKNDVKTLKSNAKKVERKRKIATEDKSAEAVSDDGEEVNGE
jgi:predicted  nucleic acid-binding Zn-ribbon protein